MSCMARQPAVFSAPPAARLDTSHPLPPTASTRPSTASQSTGLAPTPAPLSTATLRYTTKCKGRPRYPQWKTYLFRLRLVKTSPTACSAPRSAWTRSRRHLHHSNRWKTSAALNLAYPLPLPNMPWKSTLAVSTISLTN